jgi:hypothetical protein
MHLYRHVRSARLWAYTLFALLFATAILPSSSVVHAHKLKEGRYTQTEQTTPGANATYAGEVFIDYNRNGIRELHEAGFQDITVRIETLAGDLIAETSSDVDGYYIFTDLPEEMVRVRVLAPNDYHVSVNGDFVIATNAPQGPAVRSTGLFIGVYLPIIGIR